MPRSSRASLSEETIKELEDQFYTFIDSLSSDERRKFFGEFLTVEEKMMMYKRLALYWCLLEGYSLAKIQQMIGVTHDTTRVYNKKKNTLSSEFKELVQRIAKNEAIEEASVKPIEEEQKVEEPTMQEEVKEAETTADDMLQMEEVKEPEVSEEEHLETSEEKHEEAHVEPETETKEESVDQKTMDDSENNIWAVEHKEEEKMEETKSEESEMSSQESQSTDTSESSEEEKKEEDGGEKKKGWGKFFGF